MKSKLNLYVIKDTVGGYYMSPFTSINHDTAKRNFAKVCSSVEYSGDFELFQVGTYDSDTGVVEPCKHEFVINGSDING